MDIFENIDIQSSVAVYIQIENQVQFAIASGRVKPGDRLPSVRDLSDKLELNPNTVAKAYRDLEVMGLIYTRRGMGCFIADGVHGKCVEEVRRRLIGRMHEVVAEARAAGMPLDDIHIVVDKSYTTDAGPYSPTPASIAKLAKAKNLAK